MRGKWPNSTQKLEEILTTPVTTQSSSLTNITRFQWDFVELWWSPFSLGWSQEPRKQSLQRKSRRIIRATSSVPSITTTTSHQPPFRFTEWTKWTSWIGKCLQWCTVLWPCATLCTLFWRGSSWLGTPSKSIRGDPQSGSCSSIPKMSSTSNLLKWGAKWDSRYLSNYSGTNLRIARASWLHEGSFQWQNQTQWHSLHVLVQKGLPWTYFLIYSHVYNPISVFIRSFILAKISVLIWTAKNWEW